MTQYPLDVASDQVVRWLIQEKKEGRRVWRIRTTREYIQDAEANLEDFGVSPEADVASLVTVGNLEAELPEEHPSWCLKIRVEDVVGPHAPEDQSVSEGPEEIDLEAFEAEFILPDRGTLYVSLDAETEEGKRQFDRLYGELIRNQHRR